MSLQNRVMPDMRIVAEKWRGDFMGNRGGRIHDPETKTLLSRKWASKRWIICVTEFKQRQRVVMGKSYTELFFLDEVTALAAGHRPCFECRRKTANAYLNAWIEAFGKPEKSMADSMDKQLHHERTAKNSTLSKQALLSLPNGSMVKTGETCFAKRDGDFLKWSGDGYKKSNLTSSDVSLLTPPSTLAVLKQGYKPQWHKSAH